MNISMAGQQAPGVQGTPASPSPSPPDDPLVTSHETAKAQLSQVSAIKTLLDHVKNELGALTKLGDMVTPEDVIEGAGKLVAHGAPAGQIAALLADMPDSGGPALQAWLAQHEAMVAQKEVELTPVHQVLGHRAAVAGLRLLAAHGQVAGPPSPPTNPLTAPAAGAPSLSAPTQS